MSSDIGLLILRLVVGLSLAGHRAQKRSGWFGGPGLKGFAGWRDSMGLRPARFWPNEARVCLAIQRLDRT
jgi:putative oxidoreductase